MSKLNNVVVTSLGIILGLTLSHSVLAGDADKARKGIAGTVTCGGNHFFRNGGSELHRSRYPIRNVSDTGSISIDRVRLYTADGNIAFDSNLTGLPIFTNGVISQADPILDPHQTARLAIESIMGPVSPNLRPFQTVIDWSAANRTLTLEVGHARVINKVDTLTGKVGAQTARSSSACRTVYLDKS